MKKLSLRRVLRAISNYAVFFLTVAFAVSCCTMLFVSTLTSDLNITLTQENVTAAAKITFVNVVLLTLAFALIDYLRRRFMVERPVKQIIQATNRIMQGDFTVRLKHFPNALGGNDFNPIVDAINNMAQELSGTEMLRNDFIANVSHELKTPLSVMGSLASMLAAPDITEDERREYAGALNAAVKRQSSLITNILQLNKLENQQIFPKNQRFHLTEQLCQCMLQFEELWEEKGVQIETDLQEDVFITSDPELLSLVWNNLISNALKFTPAGGTVRLSLKAEGGSAMVTVADTGCGFGKEVGRRIFEKFYQGDTSHTTAGNGLGLALVKRVADILGAEISVESEIGEGSTFRVKLRT